MRSLMLKLNARSKIVFYPKPINFHKSFDALTFLVQADLQIQLVPNVFVLFSNARKNRVKILYHDGMHLLILSTRIPHALCFSFHEDVFLDWKTLKDFLLSKGTRGPKKNKN